MFSPFPPQTPTQYLLCMTTCEGLSDSGRMTTIVLHRRATYKNGWTGGFSSAAKGSCLGVVTTRGSVTMAAELV